ncbi:hypothetical protein [Breznakiella homolactica]|uniref:hypothetical protein n=1 Tax=Breznakiella homolactica TaxID=2798577 RepID=UPI001CBA5F20|nr:hypothetical protein [Breznakiella homolactica]QQO09485.2 hypothetical protein JFL75_00765 [Breznakiella homolactica]
MPYNNGMYSVSYLLEHSNLPSPRGNLELLHEFSRQADAAAIKECLAYIKTDTANSPEEFAGMCGIVGYGLYHSDDIPGTVKFLRPYASHGSWRIREAVAIAFQEIAAKGIPPRQGRKDFSKEKNPFLERLLEETAPWIQGNPLEQRALAAAFCEPKLLTNAAANKRILRLLQTITNTFENSGSLSDDEKVLRKTLGYGWSVVIAAQPEEGKKLFESMAGSTNKHIRWIAKENLKKNRLIKMDENWTRKMLSVLEI